METHNPLPKETEEGEQRKEEEKEGVGVGEEQTGGMKMAGATRGMGMWRTGILLVSNTS